MSGTTVGRWCGVLVVFCSYKEANPESPLGAESVHVLLYALLILNTSLHNPVVKRSRQAAMSRASFCQMVGRCVFKCLFTFPYFPWASMLTGRRQSQQTVGCRHSPCQVSVAFSCLLWRQLAFFGLCGGLAQVEAAGVELSPEALGLLYSRIANEELRTVHSVSEKVTGSAGSVFSHLPPFPSATLSARRSRAH